MDGLVSFPLFGFLSRLAMAYAAQPVLPPPPPPDLRERDRRERSRSPATEELWRKLAGVCRSRRCVFVCCESCILRVQEVVGSWTATRDA